LAHIGGPCSAPITASTRVKRNNYYIPKIQKTYSLLFEYSGYLHCCSRPKVSLVQSLVHTTQSLPVFTVVHAGGVANLSCPERSAIHSGKDAACRCRAIYRRHLSNADDMLRRTDVMNIHTYERRYITKFSIVTSANIAQYNGNAFCRRSHRNQCHNVDLLIYKYVSNKVPLVNKIYLCELVQAFSL